MDTKILETPVWEKDIYRIQVDDYILGGHEGKINTQPRQIANRTLYLLGLMIAEHKSDGTHFVTGEQVSTKPEDRIEEVHTQLDVPFTELRAELNTLKNRLEVLKDIVKEISGTDGNRTQSLIKAQKFIWKYGNYSFAWEMFNDTLTSSTKITKDIGRTNSGDDTIILSDNENVEGIIEGHPYVIWSKDDKSDSEVVAVNDIVSDQWVRVSDDISSTMEDGKLATTTWDYKDNHAISEPGTIYISDRLTNLTNSANGTLVINRDAGEGKLKVTFYGDNTASASDGCSKCATCSVLDCPRKDTGCEHCITTTKKWTTCELDKTEVLSDGHVEETYILPSDYGYYVVENVGDETVTVYTMAAFSELPSSGVDPIKKPDVELPKGETKRDEVFTQFDDFRTAYQDNHAYTTYVFTDDMGSNAYTYKVMEPADDGSQTVYVSKRVDDLLDGTFTTSASEQIDMPIWDEDTESYIQDDQTGSLVFTAMYKVTIYRPDGTVYPIEGMRRFRINADGTISNLNMYEDKDNKLVYMDMYSKKYADYYTADPDNIPEFSVYKYDSTYDATSELYHITVYEDENKTIVHKEYYSQYVDGRTEDYYFIQSVDPITTYTDITIFDGAGNVITTYSEETPTHDGIHIPMRESPDEGTYTVTCQHGSDMGDVSKWSEEHTVVIGKIGGGTGEDDDTGGYFGFDGIEGVYRSQPGKFDDPDHGKFRSIHDPL